MSGWRLFLPPARHGPRMISGADDYLYFDDWGERLVVLRLEYETEEMIPIGTN